MNIRITADSTCDLSAAQAAAWGITVIPLYVEMDGTYRRDGEEVTPQDIFEYVDRTGKLCSTAAVSVGDYLERFGALLEECDAVIHFTISAGMSSCWQNACLAAAELDGRVFVIDSENLSSGIALLALDAAEMARSGMAAAQIAAALEEKKKKLDVSFVLDTLVYLHKGGRCSAVAALGANMLGLKPLIEVRSGAMGVGKKYRGPSKKVLVQYVTDRLAGREDIDLSRIFITDSGVDDEVRSAVEQAVCACGGFAEVLHATAGSTISNHCGPRCLGILYYHK